MWTSVKLHFSVNTKILEFLKVHHFFSWASKFSFVVKALLTSLQRTVLAKKEVKNIIIFYANFEIF